MNRALPNENLNMQDKHVLVYGLGVTGIASVEAFQQMGANVCVYDENTKVDPASLFQSFDTHPTILREIDAIPWSELDFVLKSPGISLETTLLQKAAAEGVPVFSDLEIAYRIFGAADIIAITGSNGKTTTTTLVGHLLVTAGIPNVICGNIGIGMLKAMLESPKGTKYVIECSSFQLASTSAFRPHIAAILNITPDHLTWHNTMEAYVDAKVAVTINQKPEDYCFLNRSDARAQEIAAKTNAEVVWIDRSGEEGRKLASDSNAWHLVGVHNIENALFGAAIARRAGADEESIAEGLRTFQAVPHRSEYVDEIDGVKYYNDSKATNVDSTVKALSAFEQPVVLIAGGMDKKVPFDDFFVALKPKCKALILLGETKYQIAGWADEQGMKEKTYLVDDMVQAVQKARSLATSGDVVLLSPASASWDMYKSFEERGDQFKGLVKELR